MGATARSYGHESARLDALARVAGAAAQGGGLDVVATAIAEGVRSAFGFEAVLNLYDEGRDRYVARAVAGDGAGNLLGSASTHAAFESLMAPRFEVVPDVYFIAHDDRPGLGEDVREAATVRSPFGLLV